MESLGGGTFTGSSAGGLIAPAWCSLVGTVVAVVSGIVAVTDGLATGGVSGGLVATPATPVPWAHALLSSNTAASPPICPDRMVLTCVTVSNDNLYLCSRLGDRS
ncbi:hypothetical protein GCM10022248_09690 [Nonomuraea soli]